MHVCHLLSPVSIAPYVHVFRTDPWGGERAEMVLPPSAAVDYL